MELNRKSLIENKNEWIEAGYKLPEFDFDKALENTKNAPEWVHFGAGNIFRAFQANVVQRLLNSGVMSTGLVAIEGFDYEIITRGYRPADNLSILATLKSDGNVEKTVIGSILESFVLDRDEKEDFEALKAIFNNPSLQMVSFTITEKGYVTKDQAGCVTPAVKADIEAGPELACSYMGKVVSLLYSRYINGALPVAMVSMDNCSHNGDKLKDAVMTYAQGWADNGKAEAGFVQYLTDAAKVSFPWSMIDKITPRPDAKVEALLGKDGIGGLNPFVTSKNTYVAPFVNAEECEYLVIEDTFPAGRPELDKAGVLFTERETVDKVEKMKVCTCLNPLHTSLAIYGCLLGYDLISDEMKDAELKKLVETIGYVEGLPVVINPGILDPKKFIDQVVNVRIPNPFMPDTPQRIATDTSQKLPIRFGETIKAYIRDENKNVNDLKLIPLVYAGWLRYLMGIDDEGKAFEPSSDPLLESASAYVKNVTLGEVPADMSFLDELLSDANIFGVNLVEIGMDKLVKKYFAELIAGTGAVRETLKKATA